VSCCWLFVFDEESILLMFSTEVQALWAGAVGVSPLPNVLVNRIPKWVYIDKPFMSLYSFDVKPNCDLTESFILVERLTNSFV
jgi:hypothetical protein